MRSRTSKLSSYSQNRTSKLNGDEFFVTILKLEHAWNIKDLISLMVNYCLSVAKWEVPLVKANNEW